VAAAESPARLRDGIHPREYAASPVRRRRWVNPVAQAGEDALHRRRRAYSRTSSRSLMKLDRPPATKSRRSAISS
jgi:hypothetical protein